MQRSKLRPISPPRWWGRPVHAAALAALLARLAMAALAAAERSRQRRRLAELPDRLLADIGVTRDEVRRECARSWWP